MNKILILKGFNNYQNRIYREAPSLQSYRDTVGSANYIDYTQDRSFNINDGISSEITINITDPSKEDFMADYCIVYDVVNNFEVIKSRWFVIEQRWNRQGQYRATLRRDLLVDYRNMYDTAPMLINKGYPTEGSTEIYNSEGLQYSQIKEYQYDIGNSEIQWIVCYLNKNRSGRDLNKLTGNETPKFGYPIFYSAGPRIVDEDKNYISYANYIWIDSNLSTIQVFNEEAEPAASYKKAWDELQTYAPLAEGKTKDAAYDIICFPYSKYKIDIRVRVDSIYTLDEYKALDLATALKYTMQDDLYDIQLCPYCPVDGITSTFNTQSGKVEVIVDSSVSDDILIPTYQIAYKYAIADAGGQDTIRNFVTSVTPQLAVYGFYATSKDIVIEYSIPFPYDISNTELRKINSECRFLRICSPTGKSIWDYNTTKNGDKPTTYNVYITFKPGQPYVHILPKEFGGLYRTTFENDTRGMIDTSSYSITTIVDSWMQYVQQNSNYQDIFNRQIESMEVQHFHSLLGDLTGSITGAFGAGVTGKMLGGKDAGNALALGAGVTSFAGGFADLAINQMLRNEQMNLTKDIHNMSIEQIKARPDTLSRISNIDIDSHLVPYAEYYTASEDEISYLKNLLKYRGYTINRISTFDDMYTNAFIDNSESVFISGKIIECTALKEDAHVFSELNKELIAGVRFLI